MKREIRDSLRDLRERVEALAHEPPRLLDVIVDADGVAREVLDEGGRQLPPSELMALGLPKRVAPGHFRDAAGRPREATLHELADYRDGRRPLLVSNAQRPALGVLLPSPPAPGNTPRSNR